MRAYTILAAVVVAAVPQWARAGVDEGGVATDKTPWSGYWWPHSQGGLQKPAAKHDTITGKKAKDWEEKHHPTNVPRWYGFCHAWAASAVTEREPRAATTAGGVALSVGDQKGLLALCHTQDVVNSYGQRNNGGMGVDPNDLAPDELWRLLKLYVQQQRIPLIVDTSADTEVWNYPVYAYRVTYTPSRSGPAGTVNAAMTLYVADDGVPAEYVGTVTRGFEYKFTCVMNGDKVVAGTGKWDNPDRHPDFAWYPYLTVPENPEVDVAAVRKMIGIRDDKVDPTPIDLNNLVRPNPIPGGGTFRPDAAHRVTALTAQQLAAAVVNRTSAFKLDVWVDRFDGGQYLVGDTFTVAGKSEKDGYLYLFEILPEDLAQPKDKEWPKPVPLRLLYPLPGQDNRVKAGKDFQFPGPNDKFTFAAAEPVGRHKVKAIVTTRPLMLTGIDMSDRGPGQQQQKGQACGLRLPPQEQQQLQAVISQHSADKLKPEDADKLLGEKPKDFLGEFAQDECPFIVQSMAPKPIKP